jgi:nanoRNase/pAp phosphatase (c-di-AMP/oligoRNAs hydrolase)
MSIYEVPTKDSLYQIPIRDSLVVGHVNPDGDSLSSIKAVINWLRKNGKNAYTRLEGKVPEHLSWIISENDIVDYIPEVEQIIVLDCAPNSKRVGFEFSQPCVNIDHHFIRKNEHSSKDNIYVLNRCSTASALVLDFKIFDPILLVGLYTDTLFTRSLNEVFETFKELEIEDDVAEEILSAIKPHRYMKALHGIQNAKIHTCRNGFLIAEIEETDQGVVSEIMDTLFKYSENVVLIDGLSGARLRTSNKQLIESETLSEVANIFSGGGHPFASKCDVSGKKTAFLGVIKQLKIIENKISIGSDGYEEKI